MESYDWSKFITRIPVRASKEDLYRAWATRRGIEHWFLRMSEYRNADGTLHDADTYVKTGDTYAWRWHGWPDEVEERGRIVRCNGKDEFAFTFGEAGVCHVRIIEASGETIVELEQTDIPTDEKGKHYWHLGCKTGWTFYLANLKSLMEGGIDLRIRMRRLRMS
jgi:uncharacterized protein YndB with AHSA1/START domain